MIDGRDLGDVRNRTRWQDEARMARKVTRSAFAVNTGGISCWQGLLALQRRWAGALCTGP